MPEMSFGEPSPLPLLKQHQPVRLFTPTGPLVKKQNAAVPQRKVIVERESGYFEKKSGGFCIGNDFRRALLVAPSQVAPTGTAFHANWTPGAPHTILHVPQTRIGLGKWLVVYRK